MSPIEKAISKAHVCLRVVISATNLRPRSIGGGETYAVGLANALSARSDVTCAIVAQRDAIPRLRRTLSETVDVLSLTPAPGPVRVMRDLLLLDRAVRRWQPDLLHFPHEWAPRTRLPVVLTVQNVYWLDPLTRRDSGCRGTLLRRLAAATASHAAATIGVSNHASRLWERTTGQAVTDIVPEGFSDELPPVDPEPLPHEFVLGVTGNAGYKNLPLLLEAHRRFRGRPGFGPPLVVAGATGASTDDVTYLGRVDRPLLLELMRRTTLTVFPSSVESFGLPALESLACGTPCVVLDGTAMSNWFSPHVCTSRATGRDLAAAMTSAIMTQIDRRAVDEIRASFAWPKIAALTVDVYKRSIAAAGDNRT